ncbi:hypothetical protein [Methylophaga sp. OBS1]|uniref:hypothetical protein n=1 Tax=Methylophaga sp. OBS1 TaxID=2991933 RepID=UPI00224E08FE|nr:hypothetical protein [Methylophaga sp. OBS1]MCX4193378.1 hypothetical protein [Methylophaga sp. OBS1]
MKRLLLHLGLPKTATTTLQHHLFQRLHDEGKINFLGKVVAYDDNGKSYFKNYQGALIRKACEEKITRPVSQELDELLLDDRLNVFSDEGIMISYPNQDNLPLTKKIENLKQILSQFDVTVVLTIRQPVDYLYSLYVQLYGQYYQANRQLDSFEKFSGQLLSTDDYNEQESVFMHKNIELLARFFETKVLVFEDIKHQPDYFCGQLAELLGVKPELVCEAILGNHENIKKRAGDGVYSQRVTSLSGIKKSLANRTRQFRKLHNLLQSIYRARFMPFERIFQMKLTERDYFHARPSPQLRHELLKKIGIPASFTAESYALSIEKMQRYGYIAPESSHGK